MSTTRIDYGTLLEIFAGTTKLFTLIVKDPVTGLPEDLSDTAVFNTGRVKIIRPDTTIVATLSITYSDRPNGEIEFTVTSTAATNANAGNWVGNMELENDSAQIVEQQNFNFNIIENY